jgi:predicted MFS family arabinose efflux permease
MDRSGVILAGLVVCAIGALFYNILPLTLGVAQDDLGLGDRDAGFLASVFFIGFTVTTLTAFFWIRRCDWRWVVGLSLLLSLGGMALAALVAGRPALWGGLLLTGCGFSALYGIGTTSLGDTSNPARWYGLKISAEALAGAVLLFVLPGTLVAEHGFPGLLAGVAGLTVVLAPLALRMPAGNALHVASREGESGDGALPRGLRSLLLLAVLAVGTFMFSATMIWAFIERLAAEASYDPVQTGRILSLSLVFAVLGSLTAVFLGSRLGIARPLAAASLVMVLALASLHLSGSFTVYAISVCVLTWAIALGITYVTTAVAELDVDGRFVVLTVPALGIGIMTSPLVGGFLSAWGGYDVLLLVSAGTTMLAAVFGAVALSRGRPLIRAARL